MDDLGVAITVTLGRMGLVSHDSQNRIACAIIASLPDWSATSTSAVPAALEQEMEFALQCQDANTFTTLISISYTLFQANRFLYRLSNVTILKLLKACNENVGVSKSILTYGLLVNACDAQSNDFKEKLFFDFFRACECEADIASASQAFLRMIELNINPKQQTLGRLMGVCVRSQNDAFAMYLYKYMCDQSIDFTPYILTKFIATLLNSNHTIFLKDLLAWCFELHTSGTGILDNESYRILTSISMRHACRDIFLKHIEDMGFVQPEGSSEQKNTDRLHLSHWIYS